VEEGWNLQKFTDSSIPAFRQSYLHVLERVDVIVLQNESSGGETCIVKGHENRDNLERRDTAENKKRAVDKAILTSKFRET
jgi:hypothetical protein